MTKKLNKKLVNSVEQISLHSHFITASRVSWSLFALLSIKKTNTDQVIAMPSFICQSIVAAVILAKWKIKFLDIDYKNGMVDYDGCSNDLENKVDAILFVHLLGNRNQIGDLRKLCDKSNIFLIEDSAQFYSNKIYDEPNEDLSHVRLISFGSTKLLDLGEGALILSNDNSLLDEVSFFESQFNFLSQSSVSSSLKNFNKEFYLIKNSLYKNYDIRTSFQKILKFYIPAISMEVNFDHCLVEKVVAGIESIGSQIELRQKNMKKYIEYFEGIDIIPVNSNTSIPWRASFRIDGFNYHQQQKLSESLRIDGYDVSNWYLPSHWYLNHAKELDIKLPNTLKLSQEIVQFWVDRHYDVQHFQTLRMLLEKRINYEKKG